MNILRLILIMMLVFSNYIILDLVHDITELLKNQNNNIIGSLNSIKSWSIFSCIVLMVYGWTIVFNKKDLQRF